MSRKFRKHYDNFSRIILSEFMNEEQLKELDVKYTAAKINRLQRKIMADVEDAA
jgi:hypothetical protein